MISVLMPIKNGHEFMDESIPSVIQQTCTDWELIIGINGLPSNSLAFQIAKAYQQQQPAGKIVVMEMDTAEIIGKSAALNHMMKQAQGHYIALLDVDDIWMPNKLHLQSKYMEHYDVIGTECVYFNNNSQNTGIKPPIPVGDFTHSHDFLSVNPVINSSCLLRRSLAYWKTELEIQGVEDYDLWLRLWKAGKLFYNLPQVLVKHRVHSQSAFNATGNHKKVAQLLQGFV